MLKVTSHSVERVILSVSSVVGRNKKNGMISDGIRRSTKADGCNHVRGQSIQLTSSSRELLFQTTTPYLINRTYQEEIESAKTCME